VILNHYEGLKRAVGANTFSRDMFTKGSRTKFNNLIAMQNSYMDTFLSLSSQANLDIYNQKLNISEVKIVEQMRKKALEADHIGGFKIDPLKWFETSTKKIGLLKETEDFIIAKLKTSDTHLDKACQLNKKLALLVHETQKERGMTAGYIGSKGKKFVTALKEQKVLSQERFDEFESLYNSTDLSSHPKIYVDELKKVIALYGGLPDIRKKVISNSISVGEAITYYTKMNSAMLESVAQTIAIAQGGFCVRNLNTLYAFLMAKERAGIERAILSNTFALKHFAKGMKEKLVRIVSEQNSYLTAFRANALPEVLEFFLDKTKSEPFQEVERMRQIALNAEEIGGFGVDAVEWFRVMTAKINVLKTIELEIEKNISNTLDSLKTKAYTGLLVSLIASAVMIVFILTVGYYLSRDIISRLLRLAIIKSSVSFKSPIFFVDVSNHFKGSILKPPIWSASKAFLRICSTIFTSDILSF